VTQAEIRAAEPGGHTAVGLSAEEAAARLETCGPNVVPPAHRTRWWQRLGLQLRDPLIIVLFIAAALTVATGDHPDAIIIAIVIIANTAVGLTEEIKADNAIAALQTMTAPDARVIRDGALTSVDAATVVPGDAIVVGEGDIVPADATLIDAAALRVDESALTGESVPVEKEPAVDGSGELAAGTVVVHGRGTAVVTRTGTQSAMGTIAAALSAPPALTPLQRRLADLGRMLAAVAGVLCVVVMTIGLARGQSAELMVVTAVSLVVAAVPESLPAVVTLSLALGARRMAARHALVRRLPAVETLGAVTVFATDKTGTLTEGQMVAELVWTPTGEATFTGTGFAPTGSVVDDDGDVTPASAPGIADALVGGVLCNDAELRAPSVPGEHWRPVGDPMEAALIAAAAKLGLVARELRGAHPRVFEAPFDSDRKRMTTVHRTPAGQFLVVCKGAPERVLTDSLLAETHERVLAARAQADAYADTGYRVLAVATATLDTLPPDVATAERELRLAGLVAFADPPRAAAASTVAAFQAAGIVPVLITGDHVATARNIAERAGILGADGRAVSGADLSDEVPDPREVRVFARTNPAQKLALVQSWQQRGDVVAMQGDGVNDAPSLRRADIGVAMGDRGTEIARQAADMVLTDDDIATVVGAVEEGRRVYANVRRFLLYGLAGGAAEILVMLFGPAVGLALPLLPAQILWVNLLTHGLPGVAMGAEPVEPGTMRRPPRPPAESVIGAGLWPRVLALATLVTVVTLAVGLWGHAYDRPWQSMVFFTIGTMQFGIALGVRAQPGTWTNPFLLVAVAGAFLLQLAGLYVPLLRELLDTRALTAAEVGVICLLAVLGYLAARVAGVDRDRSVFVTRSSRHE
jgi:P-type Ca2+ transporter type 2C